MPPTPPRLVRFSTEMLPERDRVARFREEFARKVISLDFVDRSGGKPRVDITFLELGPVAVARCAGTAGQFIRDACHVADGADEFVVFVPRGLHDFSQAGHEHLLNTGSAVMWDYARPFSSGALEAGEGRNVAVPASMLKALVANPEDRAGQVLRPGPTLGLLDGYLASLLALDEPPPAELSELIGLHLLDLVAAAMGPTAEARGIIAARGLKAARRRAVLADIARRSANPGLDLDGVAGRLGLSRRSVQRLLEETGESFTEHVTARRLDRAHAMLGDRACAHPKIIDIALAAGFANLSHFNRLFRRRFGETPSSARTNGHGGRE